MTTVHNDKSFKKTVKDKNADNHEREVLKPNAIELYTKYMRGVDLADQQMWHSLFQHKSLKWWKKLFFGLIETSFVNTIIIYKALHPRETIDRNKLRLEVVSSLLAAYTRKPNKRGRRYTNPPPMRVVDRHFDTVNPVLVGGKPQRLKCVVCCAPDGKQCRTANWCKQCQVAVHRYECFERLHTLKDHRYNCAGPGTHP